MTTRQPRTMVALIKMLRAADLLREPLSLTREWMTPEQMEKTRLLGPKVGVPTSDAPGEMHAFALVTGDDFLSVVRGGTTRSDAMTVEIAFLRRRLLGGWDMYRHKGRPGWDETGEVRGYCTLADVLDETAAFVARRKQEAEVQP